ncbi:MAG: hypothetical protein QOF76_1317 [Solirubrobacteraceae bacterium]|nr:hypothetical protein [Solirubrobacteraceae bacterium]
MLPDSSPTKLAVGRSNYQLRFEMPELEPVPDDTSLALNRLTVGHFGTPREGLVKWYLGSDLIHSTIVNDLLAADRVLCDLTEHNPNVLSELGMRMHADKPVALVRASGPGRSSTLTTSCE